VIAPATADVIAKLVAGFSDTPLLAIALATRSPLLICPAMNTNMFENTVTQENMSILRKRGVNFVEPERARWRVVGTAPVVWPTQKRSFIMLEGALGW